MDDFVNRLKFILDYLDVSASIFADKIGVQRSSLSHLLSGRNKPSLDFILKINEVYPEFCLEWLMKGENDFLTEQKDTSTPLFESQKKESKSSKLKSEKQNIPVQPPAPVSAENVSDLLSNSDKSEIESIVVLYKNGTFKKYNAQ